MKLRLAEVADCERVYLWTNAPEVRALTGAGPEPSLADHVDSYMLRITDTGSPMWIIEGDGQPVGVVRVDQIDGAARMTVALSLVARGRGIGRRAITAATRTWGLPVSASMPRANVASRACFEACGFQPAGTTGDFEHYQWSP